MRFSIIILVLILISTGCATSSNDFNPKEINTSKDGVIFGSFKFIVNNEDFTQSCRVIFNEDDKTFIKLDETGYVFGRASLGNVYIFRVLCNLGSELVEKDFKAEELNFKNIGGKYKTYFGQVEVFWSTSKKNPLWLLLGGASGGITGNSKNIYFKVTDKKNETEEAFNKMLKDKSDLTTSISLLNVSKEYLFPDQKK